MKNKLINFSKNIFKGVRLGIKELLIILLIMSILLSIFLSFEKYSNFFIFSIVFFRLFLYPLSVDLHIIL